MFHHQRSIKEKASSCRPAPNPFTARAPEQREELGLGSASLDSHLIISNKGANLFWRRYSQGMSSLAQHMSKVGGKKIIQPFVMCCKPIYYQGGWVIKCHFLEQNEAALCNASAKSFAPATRQPLLLLDTATHVMGRRMHFRGLHEHNCTAASACGWLRLGASVPHPSGWPSCIACPGGAGQCRDGFSMQCSMVCDLHL